jgi:hypothetical protein
MTVSESRLTAWPHWPPPPPQQSALAKAALARLLWDDPELLRVAGRKVRWLLPAIAETLHRQRLAPEGELTQLPDPLQDDPRVFFWVRMAVELLGACLANRQLTTTAENYCRALEAADARTALVRHLHRFRGFRTNESQQDARACPVARCDGYELPLMPQAFAGLGLEVAEPVIRAGLDFQREHVGLVEQALDNIRKYAPDIFRHFRTLIRLAALKPRTWGGYDDFSPPELPGTFLASVIRHPLEMADHLIHEFQHNRLSLIEESGPLFDSAFGNAETDARFFSPWRDKPRALYGIFHGLYVFIAVTRYWLAVHRSSETPAADRPYVIDRLLRLPRQLALAAGVLERHALLTPLGRDVLQQLLQDARDVREQVAAATLPQDSPALVVAEDGVCQPEKSKLDGRPLTAIGAVLEHVQRNDVHNQCAGLLEGLRPIAA